MCVFGLVFIKNDINFTLMTTTKCQRKKNENSCLPKKKQHKTRFTKETKNNKDKKKGNILTPDSRRTDRLTDRQTNYTCGCSSSQLNSTQRTVTQLNSVQFILILFDLNNNNNNKATQEGSKIQSLPIKRQTRRTLTLSAISAITFSL